MTRAHHMTVPAVAIDTQRMASDPTVSAWVSANAGSGKTHVLAERVVRLMLAGSTPGSILALTFTKAAAATMANRVLKMLGAWTTLDDHSLARTLAALDGQPVTPERLVFARTLFARALETPGGLKVQTIHAFCERVLHQFPFEANVAAEFSILEQRDAADIAAKAKSAMFAASADDPDGALARALRHLIGEAADQTLANLIDEAVANRAIFGDALSSPEALSQASDALIQAFMPRPDMDLASLRAEVLQDPLLPIAQWSTLATRLRQCNAGTTMENAATLLEACAIHPPSSTDAYLAIFLNDGGRGSARAKMPTKAVGTHDPELAEMIRAEHARIAALGSEIRTRRLVEGTIALMTVTADVAARIDREKARRCALDFDDLVSLTRRLFDRVDARWILFKLDQGIDHILVDEAQDTSPVQWSLIQSIADEFAVSGSARTDHRTLFVVGDEKQSIYSFQGADPLWFDRMRRHFARHFETGGRTFRRLRLGFSFRSTAGVLAAVDQTFADQAAVPGLSTDMPERHEAIRTDVPGQVDLWPLVEAEEKTDDIPWNAPRDALRRDEPTARLARRIARHAVLWTRRDQVPTGFSEPLSPRDIMILVRNRGRLFNAIINALKAADLPVAGADRLQLGEHIAIRDLMALGDALTQPENDLALACVLRSPLGGASETDLFELASQRGTRSLWSEVQARRPEIAARLSRWREQAHQMLPGAFYAHVLAGAGGRKSMLARLGPEANEALDEFLALALAHDARGAATLPGFLAQLRAAPIEVKRDMDLERDEIRVMTVHGAKGLEARLVILADATSLPDGRHDPKLFEVAMPNRTARGVLWSPRKKADTELTAAAREAVHNRQRDEYHRLLYVGMTRAADKLVICGTRIANKKTEGSWYGIVTERLGAAREVAAEDGDGTVLRWSPAEGTTAPMPTPAGLRAPATVIPDWATRDAPRALRAGRTLAPSRTTNGSAPGAADEAARRRAMARGVTMHRLLQSLPAVEASRREQATHQFLAAQASLSADERDVMARSALELFATAETAALLSAPARVEVPLVGDVRGTPVSGQIDRLIVEPNRVVIVDFKSGPRTFPVDPVPEAYIRQLALYRALLTPLFPDRPLQAAIVWTDAAAITWLDAQTLDSALDHHFL